MQRDLLFKCQQLKNKTTDTTKLKKLEIIEQILETENCFLHLRADVALNILMELGLTKDEARKTYLELSSFNVFKEGML